MQNLTIAQAYLLYSLDGKGNLPTPKEAFFLGLMTGGILDLLIVKTFLLDDRKRIIVDEELQSEYRHLEAIYRFVSDARPRRVGETVGAFSQLKEKKILGLVNDVGESLVEAKCAGLSFRGLGSGHPVYVPIPTACEGVTKALRTELLEGGEPSENAIGLFCLLDENHLLEPIFSEQEKEKVMCRLKAIEDTLSGKAIWDIMGELG